MTKLQWFVILAAGYYAYRVFFTDWSLSPLNGGLVPGGVKNV